MVFVTRQSLYKQHAKAILDAAMDDINRNSPEEKKEKHMKLQTAYYAKLIPLFIPAASDCGDSCARCWHNVLGLSRPIMRQVSEGDVRVCIHKSCALVAQTFMLAMSEAGYDTCPLEGFDSRLVKKALNLPSDTEINMVITCGIRMPDGVRGLRYRLPFSEMYRRI